MVDLSHPSHVKSVPCGEEDSDTRRSGDGVLLQAALKLEVLCPPNHSPHGCSGNLSGTLLFGMSLKFNNFQRCPCCLVDKPVEDSSGKHSRLSMNYP